MQAIDLQKFIYQFSYHSNEPLLFNSAFFFYFFLLFLLVYRLVYNTGLTRILVLTLFSLYFFYKACGWYVGLIVLSAIIDFSLSNLIYKTEKPWNRKLLLILSLVLNLGMLAYFKYTNFFIGLMNDVQGGQIPLLKLVLPVGISFYTFENISYTIDVYRKQFKPVNNFWDYLFFLSFFPKLMMGPIVRAADFIPQIRKNVELTARDVSEGLFLILTGCFKKIVISDFLTLNLVNYVFDDPARHTGLECLFATYGYALVIYCDFSGYSDMAIGMARWMGIKLDRNFSAPYQSSNITEFWRRWHISLSSWLKDYLYIALGGSRKGQARRYINLIITMVIGGFWHGASWNFLFWGAAHGVALAFDKIRMNLFGIKESKAIDRGISWRRIPGILITFHFVCLLWIFFKAETFEGSRIMINQIVTNFSPETWPAFFANYHSVIWLMLTGIVLHFLPLSWNERIINFVTPSHWSVKAIIATAVIFVILQFKLAETVLPVYLQF